MMKNKKMIVVLLPLVVLIWALVLYKVLGFQTDAEPAIQLVQNRSQLQEEAPKKTRFTIVADYRDPFLGSIHRPVKPKPKATKTTVIKKEKLPKPPPVQWPNIEFGGLIRNQQSQQEVAIITVNEEEALLSINDKLGGIQLKKIFNNDSILVGMNDHQKVIRKR
jgi:type II secretory pathway component PulC